MATMPRRNYSEQRILSIRYPGKLRFTSYLRGYYYNLIGGGGSGALQSGDFTVNYPETSVVYTQNSAGKALAAIANATEAAKVLGNTSGYSRARVRSLWGIRSPAYPGKRSQETGAQLRYIFQFLQPRQPRFAAGG